MKSRLTKQKQYIQDTINKFKGFFSAEDLYKEISRIDSSIGIATIYRYLKEEKTANRINSFICERKQIFSKEKVVHAHFICEKCNSHSHLDLDSLDFVKNKVNGEISHMLVDVRGICDKCSNKSL